MRGVLAVLALLAGIAQPASVRSGQMGCFIADEQSTVMGEKDTLLGVRMKYTCPVPACACDLGDVALPSPGWPGPCEARAGCITVWYDFMVTAPISVLEEPAMRLLPVAKYEVRVPLFF
jgi:hypothetical protein